MRDNQIQSSHNSRKYTFLNEMPTETLKDMIRRDCFGSEDEQLDDTTIEIILQIISKREEENRIPDVNQLWNEFQKEYILSSNSFDIVSTNPSINHSKKTVYLKPAKTLRHILIVAILCLLFGNCIAFASGYNLFDYIARWTEETFQFEKIQDTSFYQTSPLEFKDEIVIKGDLL